MLFELVANLLKPSHIFFPKIILQEKEEMKRREEAKEPSSPPIPFLPNLSEAHRSFSLPSLSSCTAAHPKLLTSLSCDGRPSHRLFPL
jgi:hypothetical protein